MRDRNHELVVWSYYIPHLQNTWMNKFAIVFSALFDCVSRDQLDTWNFSLCHYIIYRKKGQSLWRMSTWYDFLLNWPEQKKHNCDLLSIWVELLHRCLFHILKGTLFCFSFSLFLSIFIHRFRTRSVNTIYKFFCRDVEDIMFLLSSILLSLAKSRKCLVLHNQPFRLFTLISLS